MGFHDTWVPQRCSEGAVFSAESCDCIPDPNIAKGPSKSPSVVYKHKHCFPFFLPLANQQSFFFVRVWLGCGRHFHVARWGHPSPVPREGRHTHWGDLWRQRERDIWRELQRGPVAVLPDGAGVGLPVVGPGEATPPARVPDYAAKWRRLFRQGTSVCLDSLPDRRKWRTTSGTGALSPKQGGNGLSKSNYNGEHDPTRHRQHPFLCSSSLYFIAFMISFTGR